jgi:hypothetical protein
VEEDGDDILRLLDPIKPFKKKQRRWPVSRKLDYAAKTVQHLNSDSLAELIEALETAAMLFKRRNEVVHGRIYSGFDKTDYVQSGRPNMPTRQITSEEL